MSLSAHPAGYPAIDEPWRRLPWIAPLSVLLWIALLCGFSKVLEQTPAPLELAPVRAQLFEVPLGGLREDDAHPEVAPSPPPQPRVREARLPKPVPKVVPKKEPEQHFTPPPPETSAAPTSESASSPSGATDARASAGATAGLRGDSDHEGARAIYAPLPKIPDDLREEVFQAEAVARFDVAYDGSTTVALVKATTNPRLNQIVVNTLKQWRFSPASRGGVPVDSVFEVRIPITVVE